MRPPLMLAAALLLCACAARAQVDADGNNVPEVKSHTASAPAPAKDPRRPKDDLHYFGDVALLDVVTSNGGASLFTDRGAGTRADPRRYYLLWKTAAGQQPAHPLLVFVTPSDGKHAVFPKRPLYLASAPLKTFPNAPEYRGHSYQVWAYPEKPGAKGLYAAVSGFDAHGKPAQATPLLWWGLSLGQDLESVSKDERKRVFADLGD